MKVVDSENWLWVSDIPQVTFVGMHSRDAAWGFCHRIGKMEKHLTYGKEIKKKKPPLIRTNLQSVSQTRAVQEGALRELCYSQSWEWENPWEQEAALDTCWAGMQEKEV